MKKVPNLRFKEFSGEWESRPLSELGTFFKGAGLSKADLSDEGSPCVLYGELYTKYTEVIGNVQSKTNVVLDNAVLGKVNDVLIPSSGETAIDIATASCLQQDDVILGGDLNVFRSNKVNGIFTSYQLNTSKKFEISKLAQGASVVHVYNDQLKKLRLSIPTIQEQEKIAAFFSLIDKKIALQTEKVEELKNYKKGLMQKIFSQELRFKGFSGEWESKKIGSICEIIMGQSPSSACYNEDKIGLPLIQGNADIKNRKTFPRVYTSDITKTCDVGDIIMSVRAPVGAISRSLHHACIGRGVCSIKPKQNSEFIYQFLLNYENKWSRISQGSTFESINSFDITSTNIVLPLKEEQEKIASFFSLIDKKLELEMEKLEQLQEYKKGLLQQMFI